MDGVKPYGDGRAKGAQIAGMFDRIAHSYDAINHVLSLGIDRRWRRTAVRQLARMLPHPPSKGALHVLDVATGTGDLAIDACRQIHRLSVLGIDISDAMMDIGRRKVERRALTDRITLRHEDCEALSLRDGSMDAVMSAFALRNFQRLDECLREMHRVMKPGAPIVVIDLCAPQHAPMRQLFHIYQHGLMSLAGRLIAGDKTAYAYLPASMKAVPQGEDMAQRFLRAGFNDVAHKYLFSNMCVMYYAHKNIS